MLTSFRGFATQMLRAHSHVSWTLAEPKRSIAKPSSFPNLKFDAAQPMTIAHHALIEA